MLEIYYHSEIIIWPIYPNHFKIFIKFKIVQFIQPHKSILILQMIYHQMIKYYCYL